MRSEKRIVLSCAQLLFREELSGLRNIEIAKKIYEVLEDRSYEDLREIQMLLANYAVHFKA